MDPILRVINLSKKFGSLQAVQGVSFDVHPGEVVGLAGSIGSGKSVLLMLLAGLYAPNEGDLYLNNRRLKWPFQANELGIGVIYQKPELVNRLDVTSNIYLGNEIGWPPFRGWWKVPDQHRMDQEAGRILAQLDVKIDSLRQLAGSLSSEQRQMIAIARVMTYPVKLVIIDEPTVLLSYPYQQKLLGLVQNWREQGTAVIFSSNDLDHLFTVSDRIITLHQGRKVAEVATDEVTREEVMSALLGYDQLEDINSAVWVIDGLDRAREQAERLHYYQMLMEKDLAASDALNKQLFEQLTQQLQILDQANLALQNAHRRLLTEREDERKRLARELHDQVIQDMLSINYQLEELEGENLSTMRKELACVREDIRDLVAEIRNICSNLRPLTIDSLGLGAALQSYTREWAERAGVQVSLKLDSNLGRLPEVIELSIFRIVQEGLSNVWKHAQAAVVQVELQHTSPRNLMISITDDGLGLPEDFDLANKAAQGHYGLLGISERVALLGGKLRLQKKPGGGTILQVEIPHPRVEGTVTTNHTIGDNFVRT